MDTLDQQFSRVRGAMTARIAARKAAAQPALDRAGARAQAYAQATHGWQNLTGDAERSLQYSRQPVDAPFIARGVFAGGVSYMKYLTFSHGSRYDIMRPTVALLHDWLREELAR